MYRLTITALLFFTILKGAEAQTNDGFTKLSNGLGYKSVIDKPGKNLQPGDISMIHVKLRVGDSVVYDSRKANNNKPVKQPIQEARKIQDLMAGFTKLSLGDQAIFKAPANLVFDNAKQRPPFIKDGDMLFWDVEVAQVQTKEDVAKELAKQKKAAAEALAKEDETLKAYIKKNNIRARQLETGTYVAVTKAGTGEVCKQGKMVKMKYTGYLLDGTVFDSNVDPKFQHTQPFEFPVGQGRVIKGWDNSILNMKVGTKATLIIPSANAYGARATPGNAANPKGIPANSPLIFDIEVLSVKQ